MPWSKISGRHIFHAFAAWKTETTANLRASGMEEYNMLHSYPVQRVAGAYTRPLLSSI